MLEQARNSDYFGRSIVCEMDSDVNIKLYIFQQLCASINAH